eukprot:6086007-Prymnesium_polylepis.1
MLAMRLVGRVLAISHVRHVVTHVVEEEIQPGVHLRCCRIPFLARESLDKALQHLQHGIGGNGMEASTREGLCDVGDEILGLLFGCSQQQQDAEEALQAQVDLVGHLEPAHGRQQQRVDHQVVAHTDGLFRDAVEQTDGESEARVEDKDDIARCKPSLVPLNEIEAVQFHARKLHPLRRVDWVLGMRRDHQQQDAIGNSEEESVASKVVLHVCGDVFAAQCGSASSDEKGVVHLEYHAKEPKEQEMQQTRARAHLLQVREGKLLGSAVFVFL